MTSRFVRRALGSFFFVGLVVGCLPDATSSSSSSSSGGSGGIVADGGDGGSSESGASANGREGVCASYASATATCCANGTDACPRTTVAEWNDYCLKYARACAGMPTCFSGSDCNTLIYCTGSC